jgi:hypothetical protein
MSPALVRRLSWIAMLAMLALALAPTVSRLRAVLGDAGPAGSGWTAVCSAQGSVRWVELTAVNAEGAPSAATQDEPDPGVPSEHCPLCGVAAAGLLPASPPPLLHLLPARTGMPLLFLQAPRVLHAWATGRPRGPPVLG